MLVPPASDPDSGSVSAHAPIHSPEASFGMYAFFCASLPAVLMWLVHSEMCAAVLNAMDGSTRAISSMMIE